MKKKSTILAVVAHPDDETIGIGGTLARYAAEGDEVFVLVLADGESSRGQIAGSVVEARAAQCRAACDVLGLKDVFFETFPDNAFDTRSRLEIAKTCEKYLKKLNPDTIYTHHTGDVNIDHVLSAEAVTIAARAQPGCSVRRILQFETASSTEWQLPSHARPFAPNWYVDVSEFWTQKEEALSIYKDEMRSFPHPRSVDAMRACAIWRGASVGVEKAEAFMLVRNIV